MVKYAAVCAAGDDVTGVSDADRVYVATVYLNSFVGYFHQFLIAREM
jgi:hypothetical protein